MIPLRNVLIFGFDSAWTDNPKAPGALCSIGFNPSGKPIFTPPCLVSFARALETIKETSRDYPLSICAIDQPIIVPNSCGSRPVDKIAASLVSYIGGGVQPANRGKKRMFCDNAPIWPFLNALGATQDPVAARTANTGHFVIEVFPALALPSLCSSFSGRNCGPKYNPSNKRKFRLHDWQRVASLVGRISMRFGINDLHDWAVGMATLAKPRKADQDMLDSVICLLIGLLWRSDDTQASTMLGTLETGYMISPVSLDTLARLQAATDKQNAICLT